MSCFNPPLLEQTISPCLSPFILPPPTPPTETSSNRNMPQLSTPTESFSIGATDNASRSASASSHPVDIPPPLPPYPFPRLLPSLLSQLLSAVSPLIAHSHSHSSFVSRLPLALAFFCIQVQPIQCQQRLLHLIIRRLSKARSQNRSILCKVQ